MNALKTEEDVKISFLLPYLRERGYKENCIRFEESIDVHEGRKKKTIFADAVVYTSPKSGTPLLLCETKAPNEVIDRSVKEQAISYARLFPKIIPLVLITNGAQIQIYKTVDKSRIISLPLRHEIPKDYVDLVLSAEIQYALREEAKHELFIIDDVQSFKRILRSCHNEIRNNEGYDQTTAFDEMSKILFCKMYEEKKNPTNNRFRLSIFDDTLERLGINVIQQIFGEAKQDPDYSVFLNPNDSINLNDRTIRKMVELFENYDLSLTAFDVKGEAFEYFLGDTFTGGLGEYFTPRNVVEFMVEALDPKIGDKIVDPFCGTGGFLIYAFELVSEKIRLQEFSDDEKKKWRKELSDRCLFGTDWKVRTTQACKMNMAVHGDGSAGIFLHHGLIDIKNFIEEKCFDMCITNPPFGSIENDANILSKYELGAGRKSQDRVVLAVERAIRLVKANGHIAIVVIDGILDTISAAYIRDFIKKNTRVRAVVSLAKETFQGYGAQASTSILFLEKKPLPDEGAQKSVFMAIAKNTGYAPNGAPVPGNELPDILMALKPFLKGQTIEEQGRNYWIVKELSDRFDAKYYWKGYESTDADIEEMSIRISKTLRDNSTEYEMLLGNLKSTFANVQYETVKIKELLAEIKDAEVIQPDRLYKLLGIHLWGKGAFIREEKLGREIKSRKLQRVLAGQIIYNRLFASKGCFALLISDHDGCYVSSEFPTFIVKKENSQKIPISKYLVNVLNSPQYLQIIEGQCTGSTKGSRNRFNQKLFLDIDVRIPQNNEVLDSIVFLFETLSGLRMRQEQLVREMKKLQEGIAGRVPLP